MVDAAYKRKLLIVGPAWVGDMVMAQCLFKLVKLREPDTRIDVLAPAWTQPLLQHMPEVDQGVVSPFGHGELRISQRRQLAMKLRDRRYDQAIILPNSYKSALIPFWAKVPVRTGWLGEMRWGLLNDARKLDKEKFPLMIQRFSALGLPKDADPQQIPKPRLEIAPASIAQSLLAHRLPQPEAPLLAMCPGAEFGRSKKWPIEHYAEVANALLDLGWQVWLFGSAKDFADAQAINAATDTRCVNLAGETSLSEAICLLSLSSAVVTNDSGLMHIAAALNRPTVAIYGSSSPNFTPPLADKTKILKSTIDCSPCFKRECPLKHHRCMREQTSDGVIDALMQLVPEAMPA